MAYRSYRFTLKSQESRGAPQPNICRIALNSDADAALFAGNLEVVFGAQVDTVDTTLRSNYSLPYPAGTNTEVRFVMRDADSHVQTERLYDGTSPFDAEGFAEAIVSAAPLLVLPRAAGFGGSIVSVQPAIFVPAQSY